MMWIWYLLLGSGSGSRTVGKFVVVFFFHLFCKRTESSANVVVTARTRCGVRVGCRKEEGAMGNLLKCSCCLL